MKDIQNRHDPRNLAIDKVGIRNIRYPITVMDRKNRVQHTVAWVNMYVDLPHHVKGTHMSRFVEILHSMNSQISLKGLSSILEQMKAHLGAASAHVELSFPYFIEKKAPVTKAPGLMDYDCRLFGHVDAENRLDMVCEVKVPITSVCPCSKEISDAGAHNQRGIVTLALRFTRLVWIEDMVELVERAASSEVYSVIKRIDEKFVTEAGYNNPKFVEDVVRDIALSLDSDPNITWYSVEAENMESIHNHNAYACISSDRRPSSA